jgi:hypothetical protein
MSFSPNPSDESSPHNLSKEDLPEKNWSSNADQKALKQLTISFQNVSVRVQGDDEGYWSTVASVAHALVPKFHKASSERVSHRQWHLCAFPLTFDTAHFAKHYRMRQAG